jgi:HD-like signal output (HDOD) protein
MAATTAPNVDAFSFVAELAEDLKDERLELPAFPDAVVRIQRALQNDRTTIGEISNLVASEPALATRMLRIANSAEFRRKGDKITEIRTAVARMGYTMVRSVAVSFAMRQMSGRTAKHQSVRAELKKLWSESVQVAALCYTIARMHGSELNADEALLSGLLHVVGRLYIAMKAAERELTSEEIAEFSNILRDWHGTIAKAILESWGIAEHICEAVSDQDLCDEDFKDMPISLSDVLIAAKLYLEHVSARERSEPESLDGYSCVRRLTRGKGGFVEKMEKLQPETTEILRSLSD